MSGEETSESDEISERLSAEGSLRTSVARGSWVFGSVTSRGIEASLVTVDGNPAFFKATDSSPSSWMIWKASGMKGQLCTETFESKIFFCISVLYFPEYCICDLGEQCLMEPSHCLIQHLAIAIMILKMYFQRKLSWKLSQKYIWKLHL